jgi:DNA-directed RNA polymerase subunit RPC12/RpoP
MRRQYIMIQYIERNMTSESESYKCSKCRRDFATRKDLDDHLIQMKGTIDNPCAKCGTIFHTRKDLDDHLIQMIDAHDWIHDR